MDELGEAASLPIGIATIKLVIEEEDTAIITARELINRTQQAVNLQLPQKQLLELIETILVYKLTNLTRQEIEAMFTLDELKQTRYFREVAEDAKVEGKLEGKLETVPLLLELGLTVEEIAARLAVDIEAVRQIAEKSGNQTSSD